MEFLACISLFLATLLTRSLAIFFLIPNQPGRRPGGHWSDIQLCHVALPLGRRDCWRPARAQCLFSAYQPQYHSIQSRYCTDPAPLVPLWLTDAILVSHSKLRCDLRQALVGFSLLGLTTVGHDDIKYPIHIGPVVYPALVCRWPVAGASVPALPALQPAECEVFFLHT